MNKMDVEYQKEFTKSSVIERNKVLITTLLAFLGIFGPISYLVGLSYHQGYLKVFGINSAFFPITTQDAYVSAYLVVSAYIINIFSYIFTLKTLNFISVFFTFLITFGFLSLKAKKWKNSTNNKKKSSKNILKKIETYLSPKKNDLTKAFIVIFKIFSHVSILSYMAIVIALIWLTITITGYWKGEELAQEKHNTFMKEGCNYDDITGWYSCSQLVNKENKIIIEGYVIASTNTKVAFFNEEGSTIREIKKDDRIIRPRHQVNTRISPD